MNVAELRNYIDALVKEYFAGASVLWTMESMVHAKNPSVLLNLKNIQTGTSSITFYKDGEIFDSYPATAQLEINLFTDGKVEKQPNLVLPRENTAVQDLSGLQLFLGSEYVLGRNNEANVNLLPLGPVNNVSSVRDNTEREFSAMQEYTVYFYMEVVGYAGVKGTENYSGGAQKNLQQIQTDYFEKVEVEMEESNGK